MNVYLKSEEITDLQGPCSVGYHVARRSDSNMIKDILTTLLGHTPVGSELNTYLLLPSAGYIPYNSMTRTGVGESGRCWTVNWYGITESITYINAITWGSSGLSTAMTTTGYNRRGTGYPIRPIKDVTVEPDNSWTTLLDGSSTAAGAGVFHNSSLGLISLSSDGVDWITIADKNLGATSTDVTSSNSYGKYYQWGNNYGFTPGSMTSTSTRVDASGYGPGNYYYSYNYITTGSNNDWSTVRNDNLWGGVTGSLKMNELNNAYIGEAPYEGNDLCFTANTAGSTVKLTKIGSPTAVTLETSTDGNTWSTYTFGNTITLTNIGDKVYFRNTSESDTGFSTSDSNYYRFVMTGSIAGSGDINYLLNKNSTTTVSSYCYCQLFHDCAILTKAPALPATTLAQYCYFYMFNWCTGLTTVPQLPATTLADGCYLYLFNGCSKIKLSRTQTGEYQTAYRIPKTGTGTTATDALLGMFASTGGTLTGTPSINTTYYTSNTVV